MRQAWFLIVGGRLDWDAGMSLLTVPEVAAALRVSVEHVRRSIRRGDLPAMNLATSGRPMYRISQSVLDRYLNARRTS